MLCASSLQKGSHDVILDPEEELRQHAIQSAEQMFCSPVHATALPLPSSSSGDRLQGFVCGATPPVEAGVGLETDPQCFRELEVRGQPTAACTAETNSRPQQALQLLP